MKELEYYNSIVDRKLKCFPTGFWTNSTSEQDGNLVRDLVENKLEWTEEDVKNKFSIKVLKNWYLNGLALKYANDVNTIVKLAYPNIDIVKKDKKEVWNKCKPLIKIIE